MRYLIILLIFAWITNTTTAQKLYAPKEEKAFAELYLSQSTLINSTAQAQLELMKKYNISKDRYRTLVDQDLAADYVKSDQENQFLVELRQLNQETKDLKSNKIKEALKKSILDWEDYNTLLDRYKNDPEFAKRIQSYFKDIKKAS